MKWLTDNLDMKWLTAQQQQADVLSIRIHKNEDF
jgi:hypothetical protein